MEAKSLRNIEDLFEIAELRDKPFILSLSEEARFLQVNLDGHQGGGGNSGDT